MLKKYKRLPPIISRGIWPSQNNGIFGDTSSSPHKVETQVMDIFSLLHDMIFRHNPWNIIAKEIHCSTTWGYFGWGLFMRRWIPQAPHRSYSLFIGKPLLHFVEWIWHTTNQLCWIVGLKLPLFDILKEWHRIQTFGNSMIIIN